jgi:hypothetical protein
MANIKRARLASIKVRPTNQVIDISIGSMEVSMQASTHESSSQMINDTGMQTTVVVFTHPAVHLSVYIVLRTFCVITFGKLLYNQ